MRILLVKTSSLGDVIHNLPVVADIIRQRPDAVIDWCVEAPFADIPALSPAVHRVIPVAVRRWRKSLFSPGTWAEICERRRQLRESAYDLILDTQGLLKSAFIARQACGRVMGYAADSAREPLAARFYDETFSVGPHQHAVVRNRQLAASALAYPLPEALDYGISAPVVDFSWLPQGPSAVLLTATSRDDKLWPEDRWVELAKALLQRGITPILPAGNVTEQQRAQRIASQAPGSIAAPLLSIRELAGILGRAGLAVGVDTGLAHLATALRVPSIALYTATNPALTGILGTGFFRNLGGIGQTPRCDEVLALVDEILQGPS